MTWPSPAPSGAPSSCSRYTHRPHQPASLPPPWLAASYTHSPLFLTPTLPLPHIHSLHLGVCTHTTNLCVHNLYQTCSNSTRSYLYTLRTTNFLCTPHTATTLYTPATYFVKFLPCRQTTSTTSVVTRHSPPICSLSIGVVIEPRVQREAPASLPASRPPCLDTQHERRPLGASSCGE